MMLHVCVLDGVCLYHIIIINYTDCQLMLHCIIYIYIYMFPKRRKTVRMAGCVTQSITKKSMTNDPI